MTGRETLEAFFQKFKLIKANLEEAEAHKGPLTNAREILTDLRKMFLVAAVGSVDYQIVADGNTGLANKLKEANAELSQSRHEVAELQKESDAQQGVSKELRQLVKELRGELDALHGRLQEMGG